MRLKHKKMHGSSFLGGRMMTFPLEKITPHLQEHQKIPRTFKRPSLQQFLQQQKHLKPLFYELQYKLNTNTLVVLVFGEKPGKY
jgi:hypothetical protein